MRTDRVMESGEAREGLINGEEKNLNNAVKSTLTPLLALSSVASLSVGYAAGFSSPIESHYSMFGSLLTIGGIIGALVNGKVADPFGRRGSRAAGWLAIAFAKDSWGQNLGRLLSDSNRLSLVKNMILKHPFTGLVERLQIYDFTETVEQHSKSTFWEMFQTRYAPSLIVGIGLLCLQQFEGARAFSYYVSSISAGKFFIYTSFCGSLLLFFTMLVPESKGRSLEQTHASLTHRLL